MNILQAEDLIKGMLDQRLLYTLNATMDAFQNIDKTSKPTMPMKQPGIQGEARRECHADTG